MKTWELFQPRGSKVSTTELLCEVDEYFSIGAHVRPGDTVVDVGANVGAFSMRVAERCDGDVRLLCFEPSQELCGALRANFEQQPLLARTRHSIHGSGLTSLENAESRLPFFYFRRFPTNSTFDLPSKRRELEIFFEDRGRRLRESVEHAIAAIGSFFGRIIQAITSAVPRGAIGWWLTKRIMGLESSSVRLDALGRVLSREGVERVDLLKIDVEGFELEVLRGLSEDTWPLVRQVVLETNDVQGKRGPIERLLRAHGLTRIRTALQRSVDNGLESVVLFATRA
jgi:FkbM family methyltransferase